MEYPNAHDEFWRHWSAIIASGEPVASSLLVRAAGLGVSSATVRNVLAHLEADGFVQQPHVGGRVPTDRGYRFYVDLLLGSKRRHRAANVVEARLRRESIAHWPTSCSHQASHVVSQASRHVGFALSSAQDAAVFDRVRVRPARQFARARRHRRQGRACVQKVIDTGEVLGADSLRRSANH